MHTEKAWALPMIIIMITNMGSHRWKMNKVGKALPMIVEHMPSYQHPWACHHCWGLSSRTVTTNDHQNQTVLDVGCQNRPRSRLESI